jgi:MFS family permease
MGQFIATPLWGRLSDRIGRKPVLLISIYCQSICFMALALAPNLWMLALARFMGGIVSGNISTAMAYVSDSTNEEKRAKWLGYIGASVSIGFMTGPAIGGLLGGQDASSASLFYPGIVAASIAFMTGIIAIFFLKESLKPEHRNPNTNKESSLLKNWGLVFKRPVLAEIVLLGFLMMFVTGTFETIFPLWTEARFYWGPMQVGYSMTYIGLTVTLVQVLVVGRVVPLLGEANVIRLAFIGYFIGLFIMAQAPSWVVMMVGLTFSASSGATFGTAASSFVSKVAGDNEKGFVLGVYQSCGWLGRISGPLAVGVIFSTIGVNAPLYLGMLVLIPCIIIISVVAKKADLNNT